MVIVTGLGVCNLRDHLQSMSLVAADRECLVICTHCHFDHAGGAQHFDSVYIHEYDASALRNGRQTETLNYVKPNHFHRQPHKNFSASAYQVPPTPCSSLKTGQIIDVGEGNCLEIIHLPGHTKGSIAVYYAEKSALFVSDLVYECGHGANLIDWLPTSSVSQYVESARAMLAWLSEHKNVSVFPGHSGILDFRRASELLDQYIHGKHELCSRGCSGALQFATFCYFLFGCFRCCCC